MERELKQKCRRSTNWATSHDGCLLVPVSFPYIVYYLISECWYTFWLHKRSSYLSMLTKYLLDTSRLHKRWYPAKINYPRLGFLTFLLGFGCGNELTFMAWCRCINLWRWCFWCYCCHLAWSIAVTSSACYITCILSRSSWLGTASSKTKQTNQCYSKKFIFKGFKL